MTNNRILFLYAEVTPYFEKSVNYFNSLHTNYNIAIVQLDNKKTSTYEPVLNKNIIFRNKSSFKKQEEFYKFCEDFSPKLLLVSGRMDRSYLKIAKKFKKHINVVTIQDTQFNFNVSQLVKILFSKYLYRQYFSSYWGMGSMQTANALSLGFNPSRIYENFYVGSLGEPAINHKKFNKKESTTILSVARLVEEKNLEKLAQSIELINKEYNYTCKVLICGEGPLDKNLKSFNCVELLGYKTQDELKMIAEKCDLFCLLSVYEPWGLVIHEFASQGLPIVASSNCGSAFNLVQDNYNGFNVRSNDNHEIKATLLNYINLNEENKVQMSKNSRKISSMINNDIWSNTLLSLYNL